MTNPRELADILAEMIRCARCGRVAPLEDDGMPPDSWIQVHDGATHDGPTGWACPDDQTDDAIVEHMTRSAETDAATAVAKRDIELDETLGRPAAGRDTDEMIGYPTGDDA